MSSSTEEEALNAALLRSRQTKRDISDFLQELEIEKGACGAQWTADQGGLANALVSDSANVPPLLREIGRARQAASVSTEKNVSFACGFDLKDSKDANSASGKVRANTKTSVQTPAAPVSRTPLRDIDAVSVSPPRLEIIQRNDPLDGGKRQHRAWHQGRNGAFPAARCLRRAPPPTPPPEFRGRPSPPSTSGKSRLSPLCLNSSSSAADSPQRGAAYSRENSVFALTSLKDSSTPVSPTSASSSATASPHSLGFPPAPQNSSTAGVFVDGSVDGTTLLSSVVKNYLQDKGSRVVFHPCSGGASGGTSPNKRKTETNKAKKEETDFFELDTGPLAQLDWITEDEGCLFSPLTKQADVGENSKEADEIVARDRLGVQEPGTSTVVQLLTAEREAVLRQENLISKEEFTLQLKVADELLAGWRVVERLDLAIEQRESQLRNLKVEIRRTRERMRYAINDGTK